MVHSAPPRAEPRSTHPAFIPPAPEQPISGSKPTPPFTKPPKVRRRWPRYVVAGLLLYGATAYGAWFWFSFVNPKDNISEESGLIKQQKVNLSAVWDETAARFDSDVELEEKTSCLWYLRNRLVRQASGHVLEVSVGTGRNFRYYNLDACKSLTFLDQSWPMLEVAKAKWRHLYPKSAYLDKSPENTKIAFKKQAAREITEKPVEGYDTIIQTMGACSTPDPAETLSHLGTLLNQQTGRILLIEHGRGYYNWINYILDRDAHRHAEKYGCYHNRDIGSIVKESGLIIESIRRPIWWNLGTVWVIEARPQGWKNPAD